MKPHPRIRKTIKWGGAAVTVLLVVVWVGSGWVLMYHIWPDGLFAGIAHGQIGAFRSLKPVGEPPHWDFVVTSFKLRPQINLYVRTADWNIKLPLWIPVLCMLWLTVTAWILDRESQQRDRLSLCPKCGYDRTGILQDAKCPECGVGGVG